LWGWGGQNTKAAISTLRGEGGKTEKDRGSCTTEGGAPKVPKHGGNASCTHKVGSRTSVKATGLEEWGVEPRWG